MEKTHYDALEWILLYSSGLTEAEVTQTLEQGIVNGITSANIVSVLKYLHDGKMISSEGAKVIVTEIGKSQYGQEKERRDFDKSIIKAQRDLNKSQVKTNRRIVIISFISVLSAVISTYVSVREFQLHKQDTQTQSTKKGLINKQEYNTINHPTDTISNGVKTLSDSL